jgi:mono/diheme cytochrome c family protein
VFTRAWRGVRKVIGWLLWPLRWLAHAWWRALRGGGWLRRSVMVLGTVVVAAVMLLAVLVPWPGYLFVPPFRAVEYAPINDRIWLRPESAPSSITDVHEPTQWQGWTPDERQRFYYHPQGSAQVMLGQMRYAWFINLELAGSRERFAAPANMSRYGFLTNLRQQPDPRYNPGNLPVGMTKYYDVRLGTELLDFTCSLCHTGELHYRGTALRIDGGQAMHAITSMKPGQFQADLMLAMLATYADPWKFDRFARSIIEPRLATVGTKDFDFRAAKDRLRTQLKASIDTLLANAWTDLWHGSYPVFEGYGRTDATQRIANTVFGRHISPDNYRPAIAPVSYPHLWDIAKFDWVQWEGYASQPMARNVNEALGVGARLDLFDEFGAPLPAELRYDTSVHPDRLHEIEQLLSKLKAPRWPEQLFGRIDTAQAREGRVLFDVHCRHCHGPHLDPYMEPQFIDAATGNRRADVSFVLHEGGCVASTPDQPVAGAPLTAAQCLNLQHPQRIADSDGQPAYDVDDTLAVTGTRGDRHVESWRVALVPLPDIGTDRTAALAFSGNRYDASRLGWTADELLALCVSPELVRNLDPKSVSAVVGLNIMSTAITNRFFEQYPPTSRDQLFKYMGYGIFDYPRIDPQRLQNYKSRPLHGIWATPPYLHNGSVRTVYQMLSPRSERETWFWSGTKEYDPQDLGYLGQPLPGTVKFDTADIGNDNTGHEFRAGCQSNGVIGPYLEPAERRQIIEYLKAMDYVDDPEAQYETLLCRDAASVPACEQEMRNATTALHARYPRWGTPAFNALPQQAHCSSDTMVYGPLLAGPPSDATVDDLALARSCLLKVFGESEGAFRGQ